MTVAFGIARPLRTAVLALVAIRFVDETTGFLAPGNLERFRLELGTSYSLAAWMFAAAMAASLAANAVLAAGDRRSRQPLTVAGTAVLAVALGVQAAASGAAMLIVGAALLGAGATWMVHGGEIALANAVTAGDQPASLPRVLARVNLFGGVGDLTGPILIAAGRATGLSWRVLFVVAAVAVATYAVVLARTTFPPPVTERPDEDAEVPITRQARVWLLGLAALALMPLDESYLAIVLAHAERERGFSSAGAALLAIAFVAGSIAANTVLVPWVERSGAARVLGVSGASISALMLLTAVAPGWALIPIGLAFSGLIGMTWLAVTATALVANPGREGRTKLVVELMEFASLGVVLLLGIVADRAGLSTALLAYALVPLGLVVAAFGLRVSVRPGLSTRPP